MLTWQLVVMFVSFGVAIAAIIMAVVMNRRSARDITEIEQRLGARMDILESELSAMMDGAFGVASYLQKVENNLKETVQRQEQLQQRDMGNLPYNEAVRLASKGASVDELVEHCSLSRTEAELVAMLHKKSPPSVVSNKHDDQRNEATYRPSDEPTDEQLNATEQAIEKLMYEQFPQFQVDPLSSATEAALEGCSAAQPTESVSDDTDELLSFDDALTHSQELQLRQNKLNQPAPSERSNNPNEDNLNSDDRH